MVLLSRDLNTDCCSDCCSDVIVAVEVGQFHRVMAALESTSYMPDETFGQPSFAYTADSDQGDQPAALDQVAARSELALTAHETGDFLQAEVASDDRSSSPLCLRAADGTTYLLPTINPRAWIFATGTNVGQEHLTGRESMTGSRLRKGAGGEMGSVGHLCVGQADPFA
jgi:hypothetical protein